MKQPTLAQREDWNRRLMKLVDEAERAFGEPGGGVNQDSLDMALHIAFYVSSAELAFERKRDKDGIHA